MGSNGKWDGLFTVILFVTVIRMPHDDPLLAVFLGLQRAEATLLKSTKTI